MKDKCRLDVFCLFVKPLHGGWSTHWANIADVLSAVLKFVCLFFCFFQAIARWMTNLLNQHCWCAECSFKVCRALKNNTKCTAYNAGLKVDDQLLLWHYLQCTTWMTNPLNQHCWCAECSLEVCTALKKKTEHKATKCNPTLHCLQCTKWQSGWLTLALWFSAQCTSQSHKVNDQLLL